MPKKLSKNLLLNFSNVFGEFLCYSFKNIPQKSVTFLFNLVGGGSAYLAISLMLKVPFWKVSRSQANIDENFANYFFKTKANNKCLIMLKCACKGLQKSNSELER